MCSMPAYATEDGFKASLSNSARACPRKMEDGLGL